MELARPGRGRGSGCLARSPKGNSESIIAELGPHTQRGRGLATSCDKDAKYTSRLLFDLRYSLTNLRKVARWQFARIGFHMHITRQMPMFDSRFLRLHGSSKTSQACFVITSQLSTTNHKPQNSNLAPILAVKASPNTYSTPTPSKSHSYACKRQLDPTKGWTPHYFQPAAGKATTATKTKKPAQEVSHWEALHQRLVWMGRLIRYQDIVIESELGCKLSYEPWCISLTRHVHTHTMSLRRQNSTQQTTIKNKPSQMDVRVPSICKTRHTPRNPELPKAFNLRNMRYFALK